MGSKSKIQAATGSPVSRPAYWKFSRGFVLERWRVIARFRAFHGFGLAKFEFEFRFGFPREREQPQWIVYEACEKCDGTGCPCMRWRDWQSIECGCECGCDACGLLPPSNAGVVPVVTKMVYDGDGNVDYTVEQRAVFHTDDPSGSSPTCSDPVANSGDAGGGCG